MSGRRKRHELSTLVPAAAQPAARPSPTDVPSIVGPSAEDLEDAGVETPTPAALATVDAATATAPATQTAPASTTDTATTEQPAKKKPALLVADEELFQDLALGLE